MWHRKNQRWVGARPCKASNSTESWVFALKAGKPSGLRSSVLWVFLSFRSQGQDVGHGPPHTSLPTAHIDINSHAFPPLCPSTSLSLSWEQSSHTLPRASSYFPRLNSGTTTSEKPSLSSLSPKTRDTSNDTMRPRP